MDASTTDPRYQCGPGMYCPLTANNQPTIDAHVMLYLHKCRDISGKSTYKLAETHPAINYFTINLTVKYFTAVKFLKHLKL